MAGRIEIKNVKNVRSLEFKIPKPGVHLLAGRNGSGKTTLLAALYRLGHRNAFSDYFKTTVTNAKLDSFANASVSYHLDEKSVSYNYGMSRWAPTPKRNSDLLEKFGFPKVVFIAANARRIEPTADEVNKIRPVALAKSITNSISAILADERFKDLKYVNTKRGGGDVNRAFLLPTVKKGGYYSEKNFSLGELCVIKLVHEIDSIPHNSLVLIDEIEMALHPKAQAYLLKYLLEISKEKSLTVIFSTHSSSLIKRAGRGRIIYLENDGGGNIRVSPQCFPAHALGDISIDEDMSPDVLCFVEDDKASYLLNVLMQSAMKKLDGVMLPIWKIVPVGGFKEVIKFLANSDQIFPDSVRRYAVLDKDVEVESLEEARTNGKYDFLAFYDRHKQRIKYLPATPELGVYELFFERYQTKISEFQVFSEFRGLDLLSIGSDAGLDKALVGGNRRKSAKDVLRNFVEVIVRKSGESEEAVYRKLLAFYAHILERDGQGFNEIAKQIAFA